MSVFALGPALFLSVPLYSLTVKTIFFIITPI
jgi:hypothetical protein